MKERVIGAFFVLLTVLIILIPGGIVSAVALTILSLIGYREFLKVFKMEKTIFSILGYIATILYYSLLYFDFTRFLVPTFIGLMMVYLTVYVLSFPKFKDSDVFRAFFGFMYVTVLLSYVYRVRMLESGVYLAFFILISSWGNDVFAYLVGSTMGKHKLCPKVSPKKSVEGFIGGIVGAALMGAIYAFVLKDAIHISVEFCSLIAALGAIPSVIGDLAASAIKRNNDIKDYGKLIPGHGGVLDRFDSVFFTAPIIYFLVTLFINFIV